MDAAFVVTWTQPVVGREKQALDYALEVNEYWGKHAADGKCSEPEMFFFPDGHGLWLVKGDHDQLLALYEADATVRLICKGALLLADLTYQFVKTGRAAEEYLLTYAAAGQELGLV